MSARMADMDQRGHTHQTASNFSIELNPSFSLIKATTSEPSNRPPNGQGHAGQDMREWVEGGL